MKLTINHVCWLMNDFLRGLIIISQIGIENTNTGHILWFYTIESISIIKIYFQTYDSKYKVFGLEL